MMPRKICVVITARPSYSRIKSVLTAINEHKDLQLQLVVSASALLDRYGSIVETIEEDGFELTAKVYNVLEGENLSSAAKTTGLGILELSTIFYNIKPDIVVTVADRFETMATAISASYMNIPLAHIQGGEVTGNIDEKVRHSITKLSDYHFVASSDAYSRVIKLGENPELVFNTGCPSIDIASEITGDSKLNFDPFKEYTGVGATLEDLDEYIVVMQHPVTNEYDESREQVNMTLNAVHNLGIKTLWFWPNVDAGADGTSKGIRVFREKNPENKIHFFKNMRPKHFLKLLYNSKCLVGNSSVGIRECSFLGVPVVNIGTRQNRRQRGGNVIDVDYNQNQIEQAIKKSLTSKPKPSNIYGSGDAGVKTADILAKVELVHHKTIEY